MTEEKYKGIIAWFAYNPVAANLLMLVIIAVGIGSAFNIPWQYQTMCAIGNF